MGVRSTALVIMIAALCLPSPAAVQRRKAPAPAAKAPAAAPASASPTLAETGAWLKERLESLGTMTLKTEAESFDIFEDYTYEQVGLEGQTLVLKIRSKMTTYNKNPAFTLESSSTTQYWIPLADIDPDHIAILEPSAGSDRIRMDIETAGGKKSIRGHLVMSSAGKPDSEHDAAGNSARLVFEEKDTAERVAKAIAHAAKLSGAKPSPF